MKQDIETIAETEIAPGGGLANFPKSPSIRAEFLNAAQALCRQMTERHVILSNEQTRQLIVKLGIYLGKRQWRFDLLPISTIADAIAHEPQKLDNSKISLSKILENHTMYNRQMAADIRRELLKDPGNATPPAVMAESADGAYRLVECLTQRHLKEETAALGHCAGGTHIEHYRNRLAQGQSRIFSLRTGDNVPVATVEYDTGSKSITQIEGKPRKLTGSEIFFPALCQTLYALNDRIPLRGIEGLPACQINQILTKDGTFQKFDAARQNEILAGLVELNSVMPDELVASLCGNQRLTLEVTKFDLLRLPSHMEANLLTNATSFSAPALRQARNIYAPNATSFSAPALRQARNIYAPNATSFSAPALRQAGNIYAPNATSFSAPALRQAGNIHARSATSFSAPALRQAGDIDAPKATSFSAPALQKAGNIHADSATSFDAPALQQAGDIYARSATSFDASVVFRPIRTVFDTPNGPK